MWPELEVCPQNRTSLGTEQGSPLETEPLAFVFKSPPLQLTCKWEAETREGTVYGITSPLWERQVKVHVPLPPQSDGHPIQKVCQEEFNRRTQTEGALLGSALPG